ncbi:hypothetical protein [Sulfuracidifex metallicus]|nr:hypothetical protein [Sulfuracidifex metallicus]
MKIGYAILGQGTKATVIIREGKALYPQNNAFLASLRIHQK